MGAMAVPLSLRARQLVNRPDSRRGAQHRLLGEALEGEQFLGVDGLVDGEGGGGEAVRAGSEGEAGLAFGGAGRRVETTLRAGAPGGVGSIGGELFFGDGHGNGSFSNSEIA
jgi:hypothetical protein